jgi:hypothetical protein
VSRRLRAALITGMVAAVTFTVVTFYVNGWPGPPSPAIYLITPTLVLLAYLIVGLIAWQVYPGQRIGLLFTITGYAWFLPTLTQLHYPLPYTIGNLTWSLYEASTAVSIRGLTCGGAGEAAGSTRRSRLSIMRV